MGVCTPAGHDPGVAGGTPQTANATALGPIQAPVLVLALVVWFVTLNVVGRTRLFERMLSLEGLDREPQPLGGSEHA